MKKILVLFLILFAVQAQAAGIYTTVAQGIVASADIAVTLTAGSANVDLSSATIPRNYQGHLIRIFDANNVMIQGFVYTNGAGTIQNIVSAKGGTTRNWASQGAGFDDTTNCRYEIIQVRQLPVIATHSITAGNALIDTTEANAFAAPIGVDLSAYQDGQHMLALYDASGYAAIAHISATAPGGEVLSSETHTSANAASDPNSNEANATTGWVTTGTLLESTGADKSVGSYSLHTVFGSAGKTVGTTAGSFASVVGAVYLCTFDAKKVNNPTVLFVNGSGIFIKSIPTTTSWASYSSYITNNSGIDGYAGLYSFSNSSSDEVYIDNYSRKRLTTPPATGVLLLSRKGGSRGWLYKHASFNPNSAITAKILYVGD